MARSETDGTGHVQDNSIAGASCSADEMTDWRATTLADVREIRLPSYIESSGTLVAVEGEADLSMPIERVFTIAGMGLDSVRGCHALFSCRQVILCLHGTCDVLCDDGKESRTFRLDAPNLALDLPPGVWRELTGRTDDTSVIVLCDQPYKSDDYVEDIDEFRRLKAD